MEAPRLPVDELRAVFGVETLDSAEVRTDQIYEPVASASAGIWRVTAGERATVLKVVRHSDEGHPNWRSGDDPAHWYYWRREVCAYETDLLRTLPGGLRAPECKLIAERDDGSIALWLEDLGGTPATRWPLPRYGSAARHLGATQGAFIGALPDAPWLSSGWLRSYLAQRDGDLDLVGDVALWNHPLVAPWFPSPPIERLRAVRDDQELFLGVLEGLPATLTHFDLHPANLFSRDDDATAVIDWSFVGRGAIGEDAATLIGDTVLDFHVVPADLDRLDAEITSGYAAGLRAAGRLIDDRVVRLAITATMAARYAWIAPAILRAVAEDRPLLNRRRIGESIQWWAPTVMFLLDRSDEARALAAQTPPA